MNLISDELIDAGKNFADALVKNTEDLLTAKIRIRYIDKDMPRLKKIKQGDWIDLSNVETVNLKAGEFAYINLGVAIELPTGYEAIMAPRSSTFKNWGVIQTNSIGVIDSSYCGNDDIWMMPVYATRDIEIPAYTRIAQFRIQKIQPACIIEEVQFLDNKNRGGLGSTGKGKL